MTSACPHFASDCSSTVLPVPKPPGIVAVPPRASGKSVSIERCPVTNGVSSSSRPAAGRARRTGQRESIVSGSPSIQTTGSSQRALPARDVRDRAGEAGRDEDPVRERSRLLHVAEHVSRADALTDGDGRLELPASLPVERRRSDAARDHRRPPRVLAGAGEHGQRALRAVEDRAEQARAELDLERLAGVEHRLAGGQPGRVLVDLDHGVRSVEADHLARQPRRARRGRRCTGASSGRPFATTTGPATP